MASSSSKRRRDTLELISLGRASYASHSAISKLLAHVHEHGLPETYDRSAQFRARKELCRTNVDGYGPLVVNREMALSAGGTATGSFQNPLAAFAYHCKHSPHLSGIVKAAAGVQPPSVGNPWRVIVYQDGVDPSDGLAKNHSRKSTVFYWAFAEYGLRALCHEEAWLTICVSRSSLTNKLAGGASYLYQHVLELFFGDVHNLMITGINVEMHDGSRLHIFGKASVLLADIPAMKECIACKGHAGVLVCPCCMNACQHMIKDAIPLHLLTSKAISIANFDLSAFRELKRADLHKITEKNNKDHADWENGLITKETFEDNQRIRGWNWNPADIVLNPRFQLDLPNILMFDWAHCYVHDGLGDVEFGYCMAFLQKGSKHGTSLPECGAYIQKFQQPKSAPHLGHLFTDEKNKNNYRKQSFSCTGSEFLTLAPLLHRYFERVVRDRGEHVDKIDSMLAVLNVVMLLVSLKTGMVTHEALNAAILHHLTLFLAAWGESYVRPKHHYCIHLGPLLKRFGFLLSTFTHERKHRLVTRCCRDRKNLQNWDMAAIEEITCHQVWQLGLPFMDACETTQARGKILIPLREMYPGIPAEDMHLCSSVACNNGRFSPADVVTFFHEGLNVGQLVVSVAVKNNDGRWITETILARWKLAGKLRAGATWANYHVSGDDIVKVPTQNIDTVLVWALAPDGASCSIYLPPEIRPV